MRIHNLLQLIHATGRSKIRAIRRGWPVPLAWAWRPLLRHDHIVAVTGSGGKGTTVRLISGILSVRGRTHMSRRTNTYRAVARNILRARRSDRYLVQEVSGHEPGTVVKSSALLRHDVAVVTIIGEDHRKAFGSVEGIVQEKGRLVSCLPANGIAILNADDPQVMGMAGRTAARIVTFGASPHADIRLLEQRSGFPDLLSLLIADGERTALVKTQLIGDRWATAVLAAVACARALGFSLEECMHGIETVDPSHGCDSVHHIPGGPIFILDTQKAPLWTIPSSINTVRTARVPRRTMIFGTISDYTGSSSKKYHDAARSALEVCDRVFFAGRNSGRVARLEREYDRLRVFPAVRQLRDYLKETALEGELIYIKTSGVDHLERLFYDWLEPIRCWADSCGKNFSCDFCKRLYADRRTRYTGFNPDAWHGDSEGAA